MQVSSTKRCFVIAEAGVNHNGSLDMALELVDKAAQAGADAVKFQTFKADELASPSSETVAYQKEKTGFSNQYEMLKQLELSYEHHHALLERSNERGIEFMSTGFGIDDLEFLVSLGIKRIKVPSGELTNTRFLRKVAGFDLPVILSTGMAQMDEIQTALGALTSSGLSKDKLCILHCTSAYPTPVEAINLKAIETLAKTFEIEVGFSDHSQGIFAAPLAVALGATVVEKHFTLDRSLKGPDHAASLEPYELEQMIVDIHQASLALGDGQKAPQEIELEARALVRRGLVVCGNLEEGHVLQEEDIKTLRPAQGIEANHIDQVYGRKLIVALEKGANLQWEHLEGDYTDG